MDILEYDEGIFEITKFLNDPNLNEETFDSTFNENFTCQLSSGEVVELIPGGSSIKVEFSNRKKYSDLLLKFRLSEFDKQVNEITKGIIQIIPGSLLKCKQ